MEFANRMFLQDEEEEDATLTMEELEPSRNFVNPVYETMFQVRERLFYILTLILMFRRVEPPSSRRRPRSRWRRSRRDC